MRVGLLDTKEFKKDKLVEYFTDSNRIDITDNNYKLAIKVDKMIEIYNSGDDSLQKYFQIKKLFRNSDVFFSTYGFLKDFVDDKRVVYLLQYVNDITEYYANMEKGLSKKVSKELLKLEKDNYFDDYPYAEYFVREYINYNDSPYLRDFLEEKGLYENDFNRFLDILCRLNDNLYDEYEKKESRNRLSRQLETIRRLDNIRSGVISGRTKEGLEFDEIEFYCNLPFDDLDSAREIMDDFGYRKMSHVDKRLREAFDNLCCENSKEVMKYVYDHNLIYGNPAKVSEEDIRKTNYKLNDKVLTDEGKEEIIEYMKRRNIPFLVPAFNAVKYQYMTDSLKSEEEKKLTKVAKK